MNLDRLIQVALERIPGGVSTNIRLHEGPEKLIVKSARGSHVWTADGRELVDFVCGYGSILLGYNFTPLTSMQTEVLGAGIGFNATSVPEIEAAERLIQVFPNHDMVRFCTTGTEATTAAIGLACAATGRGSIAVFRNHYHGWHGPTKAPRVSFPSPAAATASSANSVFELTFNDSQACRDFFRIHGDRVACVIFEIVMMNGGGFEPAHDFIQVLHEARDRYGFLLIADEIITGFRLGLRGAQGKYGVKPDISVFGKALGGGTPIGAIAGSKAHMSLFASGRAVHAGTFNGHPLSVASASFVLDYLREHETSVYEHLDAMATCLRQGLPVAAQQAGLRCQVRGSGPVLWVDLPEDDDSMVGYRAFQGELLTRSVRVAQGGRWFVGFGHSQEDIDLTLQAVSGSFEAFAAKCLSPRSTVR